MPFYPVWWLTDIFVGILVIHVVIYVISLSTDWLPTAGAGDGRSLTLRRRSQEG